jgi:hypothetical protein
MMTATKKSKDAALYEALDLENDTSASTDDLVKMVKAHQTNDWTRHDTVDDFVNYLENLTNSVISDEATDANK